MFLYIFLVLVGLLVILFSIAFLYLKYKDWRSAYFWDISWISSREAGEPSSVKYAEKNQHFFLYGSLEKHGILMPDQELWETNMPGYWKDKWAVVKQRIENYIRKNTKLILTNDIEEIPNIEIYDDYLPKGHKDRVTRIKFVKNPSAEN